MNDQPIYLQTTGPIAEVVLNRPDKRNALNKQVWERIPELMQTVASDPDLTAVIIRGATEEAFAAGADISEFDEHFATPESAKAYEHTIRRAYDSVRELEKPTIALIQGFCFGGACALALNCDFRYADPTAKFCIPPARLGIAYSLFETKRLCDIVGPSKTSEMLMGARVIEAEEALRIGLVTRLFPATDLHRETMDFVRSLSDLSQFTIRSVKAMVREIVDGAIDDNAVSQALFEQQFKGQDYLEGRRAFMEKRPPKFTYR